MPALSQLLALPDLSLRLVQAGPGDPEITWGSITELLDLSGYLEGGEIIMTTGLALGADDPRWLDFVAALSRARAAAIGFGVGVNHGRVPAPLIAAASTYRVALFEIPLPVPFIAVSKAIASLLRADELRAARSALQTQRRLLDGSRGDQRPAEVLASIAQATGRHLALVASDDAVLASTAGYTAAHEATGSEQIVLDPEASLRLSIAGDAPLTPEGHAVIAAGSMVLGLGLRSDSFEQTRERERWERLTEMLLAGAGSQRALNVLAPEHTLPARMRVIAVRGRAESIGTWRRRRRTGLDRLVAPERSPSVGPDSTPGLASAWQLCPDDEASLTQALEAARAHDLDVVIGLPAGIAELQLSRRSAASRLRSLSRTAPLYTEPRVPQTVWADRDTPLLEAFLGLGEISSEQPIDTAANAASTAEATADQHAVTARVLGPLSRHDAATLEASDRAMLRDTLRAVFEADGQRGPAATALGIHRNTLRDRVTRAERLTGRSLADPDDRAELWLALRAEELSIV